MKITVRIFEDNGAMAHEVIQHVPMDLGLPATEAATQSIYCQVEDLLEDADPDRYWRMTIEKDGQQVVDTDDEPCELLSDLGTMLDQLEFDERDRLDALADDKAERRKEDVE